MYVSSLIFEHKSNENQIKLGDSKESSVYSSTVWLMPHMKTERMGSLARKSLTFWCLKRMCFFLSLMLDTVAETLEFCPLLILNQYYEIGKEKSPD